MIVVIIMRVFEDKEVATMMHDGADDDLDEDSNIRTGDEKVFGFELPTQVCLNTF